MGLPYDPNAPVLGIVSRLTSQKGVDLFFDIMDDILAHRDLRLVVLGSGEGRYEEFFTRMQHRYPAKVSFYSGFQNSLAHLIEAGSDIFLMPSQFEPCGLNQIYSLRYGTIPVVRKTGGLNDTVEQYSPASGEGTGFVFEHFTAEGLRWGIEAAVSTFHNRDAWVRLMRNAMSRNFSWDVQVKHYLELYARL
jgi:starch synthase